MGDGKLNIQILDEGIPVPESNVLQRGKKYTIQVSAIKILPKSVLVGDKLTIAPYLIHTLETDASLEIPTPKPDGSFDNPPVAEINFQADESCTFYVHIFYRWKVVLAIPITITVID